MNYKLYQIDLDEDTARYCFTGSEELKKFGLSFPPPRNLYKLTYEGSCEKLSTHDLWFQLNENHPADYKTRSLSKSDVVIFEFPRGCSLPLFCDSYDFKAIGFNDEDSWEIKTQFVPKDMHTEIILTDKDNEIYIGVEALLGHLKSFKNSKGEIVKLDHSQIYAALQCFYNEASKYRGNGKLKTLEEWTASGMPTFDWYAKVGDLVDDQIYENFLGILPPAKHDFSYLQVGEPTNHVNGKPTFMTFVKVDAIHWRYLGHCFYGGNENQQKFNTFENHFLELLD